MQISQTNLIMRDDTFLGVCAALGEDFGFNPNYLRIAFAVPILWNPYVVVGAYLAAGVVVLLSRLLSPNPRQAAVPQPAEASLAVPAETAAASNEAVPDPLPLAA